jgi:hypothetical protein
MNTKDRIDIMYNLNPDVDLTFYDGPKRINNGENFQGELSPAIKVNGNYVFPVTITWGFHIEDGKAVIDQPVMIVEPSEFQNNSIESYNKGKYRD